MQVVKGGSGLLMVRLTRMVRLARIIRVIRGMKYFSELRLMVTQIGSCFRMLFGSVPGVILNLISCVTGGMDWMSFYDELVKLSIEVTVAFLTYVAIMFFAVMNIVTAIFIEHAVKAGAADSDHVLKEELARDNKFMEEMMALFAAADEDESGEITYEELCDFLEDLGVRARLKLLGLEVHEAWGLFQLLDTDDSGVLGRDEFCYGCLRLRGSAKTLDTATLMSENKRVFQKVIEHVEQLREDMLSLGFRAAKESPCADSLEQVTSNHFCEQPQKQQCFV